MKKTLVLIVLCFSFASIGLAQRYTIKGSIADNISKEKLPYCSVSLHYKIDTAGIYKGIITDTNGCFEFKNIKKRDLILKVSFVGYKPLRMDIPQSFFTEKKTIELGILYLNLAGELAGVEIVAKKERIIIDEDKLTMTIDEGLIGSVTNAFELLKKVPGVFIDKDDNLTLNGKSGAAFQYNGRDLKLEYSAIVNMLKGMTPDMVESFEVLTNPGVKYDAEGTAGIINIKIKKNQNYGINGSVWGQTSYQTALNYYGSMNLSYVDDKWTTSLGFSPMRWGAKSNSRSERYTIRPQGDTILFKTEGNNEWNWANNNIYLNANYLIDTTRTIGMSFYYSFGGNPYTSNDNPYRISSSKDFANVDSSYINIDGGKQSSNGINIGLDYVKKLDTLDSKLSFDLTYGHRSSNANTDNLIKYFKGDLNTILDREEGYRRSGLSPSDNLSFRADLFKPLNKKMRFETGFKTNLSFSDRDYKSLKLDTTSGVYINVPMETNRFKYFENINSLYVSLSNTFKKKLNVRLGIRLEQTNTRGHQMVLDSITPRSYFDIFPNIRLNYKFQDDNQLTLSYAYRISRPYSGSLNPFIKKHSEYYYDSGNPYLNPQYSNSLSLSHSWKYMLFTSISYSHTKDDINYLSTPIDSSAQFEHNSLALMSSPINFGSTQNLNFHVSFNKDFFEWWSFDISSGVNYNKIISSTKKENINRDNWSNNLSIGSDFTLPKKWQINAYYYFYSSSMYGLSKSSSSQDFSLSVRKSFFKEQLSCRFGVSGLLNIDKNYSETIYQNTISKNWGTYQGPQFSFSLQYRFGKYYKNKQVSKPSVESFDDRAGGEQGQGGGMGK